MINTKLLDFSQHKMTEQSKESLYNYFVYGLEPGGFMTAVLSNDLYRAVGKADFVNISLINVYVDWLRWHAPHGSYGTPEMVCSWLTKNDYFEQFQKELVAERLMQPE